MGHTEQEGTVSESLTSSFNTFIVLYDKMPRNVPKHL